MQEQQTAGSAAASLDAGTPDASAPEAGTPEATTAERDAASAEAPTLPHATAPRPVPEDASLDHPYLYFNRELSAIDFNRRVLWLGVDERTPLLERVFFLAITASNMDEFFRKRVGGLKRQAAAGVRDLSIDGRTPQEQLGLIREAVEALYAEVDALWKDELRPRLAEEAGVHILDYESLDAEEQKRLDAYFQENIFPVLTPLAVDPGHPFPFLSNLSLSLAVTLRHPERGTEHFARLKIPTGQGRWVPLEGRENHFVPLEQLVSHNLHELFRGMEVVGAHAFRVTRNADIRRDEDEADDLIEMISEELRERRFAPVVRLEVDAAMPEAIRALLMDELALDPSDVYETDGHGIEGFLGHADCMALSKLDVPEHRYASWTPVIPARLLREGSPEDLLRQGKTPDHTDIFSVIRAGDLLIHHPYESFSSSVQRFIEEAALDPDVLAIKQTIYRTSEDSPIVDALIRAAERGKQVAVLVEVTARFDEESNIEWGRMLEKSGVHVTYGLVGLKTHAKVMLVVRREKGGIRPYCHIGTGNYNPETARLYTDLGLLTCDPAIGYDVINLFHYLTGHAPEQHYQKLLIAPQNLRDKVYEMIHAEIAQQEKSGNGRIIAKMNALSDIRTIRELYHASQAGVQVDLIVRGHTRLRPGLEGFSENIRVMSILGRFLEHTRVYYFENDGAPKVFMGSADWMSRNLEDRVEAVVGVEDEGLKKRLIDTLELALEDRRSAWDLGADGRYVLRRPADEEEAEGFQERLMRRARERTSAAENGWSTAQPAD